VSPTKQQDQQLGSSAAPKTGAANPAEAAGGRNTMTESSDMMKSFATQNPQQAQGVNRDTMMTAKVSMYERAPDDDINDSVRNQEMTSGATK